MSRNVGRTARLACHHESKRVRHSCRSSSGGPGTLLVGDSDALLIGGSGGLLVRDSDALLRGGSGPLLVRGSGVLFIGDSGISLVGSDGSCADLKTTPVSVVCTNHKQLQI